jgi:serpin B
MKNRSIFILLIAALMAACSTSPTALPDVPPTPLPDNQPTPDNSQAFAVAKSTKARVTEPQVSAADLESLVQGNNEFALALYQELRTQEGNLVYSPYSISQALAMTYTGARGETESQMAATLRFTLPQGSLHPAFNALSLELDKRAQTVVPDQAAGAFRLRIANALWGQKDYAFLPEFLDSLAENYAAGLSLLDFMKDPEAARIIINQWVYDQTEEKIKDLIPAGGITPDTRLVLTNAIYFKAAWLTQFDPSKTQEAPFYVLDGKSVTVEMMNLSTRLGYQAGEGYQVVELPYVGGEMVMTIVVPDAGQFETIEQGLDAAWLKGITSNLGYQEVNLGLPKFKFETNVGLSDVLEAMGMPLAFSQSADFSGMTGKKDLTITDVIHKAFIAVNEEGTEAAAATAVMVGITSMPAEPIALTIDRPFIFLIRDSTTGAILFVGRVTNPQ